MIVKDASCAGLTLKVGKRMGQINHIKWLKSANELSMYLVTAFDCSLVRGQA